MPGRRRETGSLEQRHLDRLADFVLRARRVEAHSLVADKNLLAFFADNPLNFQVHDNGKIFMVSRYPPEEQLESAAARIRPLILHSEGVHYSRALEAIGYFLREQPSDSQDRQTLKELRARWSQFQPSARGVSDYSLQVSDLSGENASEQISDNILAFAWIYGDVVHADETRRAETQEFGVVQRYRAASPVVAKIMITTLVTLGFVKSLMARGLFALPESTFSEAVVSDTCRFEQEAQMFYAPVEEGATMPQMGESLGPEWRPMQAPQPPDAASP